MSEILVAMVTTLGWIGTMVVWLLLRAQGSAASIMLKRYMRWSMLAWSVLVLLQTLHYLDLDLQTAGTHFSWLGLVSDNIVQIAFRGLLVLAIWNFLRDILLPQKVSTVPIVEAQIQMDPDGMVVAWNDEATVLFGWTAEEMIDTELASKLIPPQYQDAHRQGLAHYRKTAEAPIKDQRNTLPALTKDGRRIVVDIRIKETLTSRGTIFTAILTPTVVIK